MLIVNILCYALCFYCKYVCVYVFKNDCYYSVSFFVLLVYIVLFIKNNSICFFFYLKFLVFYVMLFWGMYGVVNYNIYV